MTTQIPDPSLIPAAAAPWLGTPFHVRAQIQGVGVDCIHLVAAIYIQAGVGATFAPPHYTLDGGQHLQRSLIREYVCQTRLFVCLPPMVTVQTGDLVEFNFGRVGHHCGVMVNAVEFIHAPSYPPKKVCLSPLSDPTFSRRVCAVYRPKIWATAVPGIPLQPSPSWPCAGCPKRSAIDS